MRILLVMDPLIAVPPRHYGGIERVVADLADELVHRGHAVTLWAAPGSQKATGQTVLDRSRAVRALPRQPFRATLRRWAGVDLGEAGAQLVAEVVVHAAKTVP